MLTKSHFSFDIDYVLVLILLVAAALRLPEPGSALYWADEISTLASAARLAHDGQMTWLGNPSAYSGLTAHSPLSVYLTAIPLFVTNDPFIARLWYGILGLLTVLATYGVMREYVGIMAARVAAAFVAVSPFAVYWSRFVWNPNLAPLFIVLWVWSALRGYRDHQPWAQAAHWIMLSLMIQAQAALAVMIPVSVGLLGWYLYATPRRQRTLWYFTIGAVVSLIAAIPWMIGLYGVTQGWWQIPFGVGNVHPTASSLRIPSLDFVAAIFARMTTGYDSEFIRSLDLNGYRASWYIPNLANGVFAVTALLIGSTAVGSLWAVRRRFNSEQYIQYGFLCVALAMPLAFLFFDRSISDFYFQPMLYLGAMWFGVLVQIVWQRQRIAGFALLLLLVPQAWLTLSYQDWIQRTPSTFRTTLADVDRKIREWDAQADDIVFVNDSGEEMSAFTVQEWLYMWNIFDEKYPLRIIDPPTAIAVAPQGSTVVSFAEGDFLPSRVGSGEAEQLTLSRSFRHLVVTPDDLPSPDYRPAGADTVADVLRVEGIALDDATNTGATLAVRWQPLRETAQQYQFSVRIFDGEGNRLSQIDGATLTPAAWRAGDTVVTYLTAMLPADAPPLETWEFQLLVYTYPQIDTLSLSDGSGQAMTLTRD